MPHRNVWKTAYLEPIQSIKQASHQGQAQHRLQTVKVLGRKGPVNAVHSAKTLLPKTEFDKL